MKAARLIAGLGLLAWLAAPTAAQVPPETTGQVEQLPMPPHAHWVWVGDLVLQRSALIDLDDGRFLGMINGGYGTIMPLVSSRRPEVYVPATYYSRGSRGERTDTIDIYDTATLAPVGEVVIPPKRATNAVALGHAALSDDERFLATFNWTTGTSLTIVDVEQRTVPGEIALPGCSLVFAAGPRRFFSICADGSAFSVTLDDQGHEASRQRSAPFFDPKVDPITEKAVRDGSQWLFASFDGKLYSVDVSGPQLAFGAPWSLLNDADRDQSWRIGGMQHLAVHARTGRLYALMHRGGPDTHKEPGEEVWIYDLAARKRIARIELVNPGVTIYGFSIDVGRNWIWPFNRTFDWLLDTFAPAAVGFIQVTQDDAPLLLTASQYFGSIGVYDAMSGKFLRRVGPTGWTSERLGGSVGREGRFVVTPDPTLQWVLRGGVALLFAVAAVHKWRDVARFRAAIEAYEVVPPIWAVPVGAALIAAETGVAVALWVPRTAPIAAVGAAALLALYAAAMAVALAGGRRDIDCGCGGPARRPISVGLVLRNGLLAGLALVGALPAGARVLGWFDVISIVTGATTLAVLYTAADGLLANAPHSAALRRRHVGDTMPLRAPEAAVNA